MSKRSLYDRHQFEVMLSRLSSVRADSRRQWGSMDVAQMLAHCQVPMRVALGEVTLKRGLIGVLFGGMARRKLLADKPWSHDMPTAPEFKKTGPHDFGREHEALLELLRRFSRGGRSGLTKEPHPFFGKLTTEEWDTLQWKHLDHHLKQFGV
jgi:Protein of unknown function (DUF1569)